MEASDIPNVVFSRVYILKTTVVNMKGSDSLAADHVQTDQIREFHFLDSFVTGCLKEDSKDFIIYFQRHSCKGCRLLYNAYARIAIDDAKPS